jgi:hypothetical protein
MPGPQGVMDPPRTFINCRISALQQGLAAQEKGICTDLRQRDPAPDRPN